MKLQLVSDLHLERYPDYTPEPAPEADVLILAGDIGSYQRGSLLAQRGDRDFGLGRFSPLKPDAPWKRVIFVPGNHEYDGLEYDEVGPRLREVCERLGLIWLDREVVLIDDVRFVGTTLWSDFESLAQREASPVRHDEMLKKSLRAANFYLSKNSTLRGGQHLLAEDIQPMGRDCQRWLREALIKPHDGPTVVVTHFAPTLHSNDPRYGLNPGTAGFCNHLDDLLFHVDLWVHGHLHCPNDHTVRGIESAIPWECRIVSNPRGYAVKGEQDSFQERMVVDVPRRPERYY
jgi:predicted phosphodiesterase